MKSVMSCEKCMLNWTVRPDAPGIGTLACGDCGRVYACDVPFRAAAAVVDAHVHSDPVADKLMHQRCMTATEGAPCRVIKICGKPYLERYYMGEVQALDGVICQHWLHRFLRNDGERHLHTHSWEATSSVLCGWYLEQLADGKFAVRVAASCHQIGFETLHRVAVVMPDTWTSLLVRPDRRDTWEFVGDDGERVVMQSGGVDWWKGYGPRPSGVVHG